MNILSQSRQSKTVEVAAIDKIIDRNMHNLTQLCRTTAMIYEADDCSIGLLSSKNIFIKAQSGTSIQKIATKDSISIHTILSGEPMVVTNLMRDKRFENNPLVKGASHLRFYAGVPLKSLRHEVFGVIAIYSKQARDFDVDKLRTLKIISQQVEELINGELEQASVQKQQYVEHNELSNLTERLPKAVERVERRRALAFDEHKSHLVSSGVCSRYEFLQSVERAVELSLVRSRCAGVITMRLRSRGRALSVRQSETFDIIVGELIAKHFRKTDLIACVGPGQYALLVPLLHERGNLMMLAERINGLLQTAIDTQTFPDLRLQVRRVMYPIDGYDGEELLQSGFAN